MNRTCFWSLLLRLLLRKKVRKGSKSILSNPGVWKDSIVALYLWKNFENIKFLNISAWRKFCFRRWLCRQFDPPNVAGKGGRRRVVSKNRSAGSAVSAFRIPTTGGESIGSGQHLSPPFHVCVTSEWSSWSREAGDGCFWMELRERERN